MSSERIYLDHHSTTPVDPRVLEAMLPYFSGQFGNPHSVSHAWGWEANDAVDAARASIAAAIGARPKEILFTSGATESNNLALRGAAARPRRRGDHLISVSTEHKAVLDPLARLERDGYDVTLLDVEPAPSPRAGLIDPQQVARAIRDDTLLVSVMLANNEIGAVQPLAEIGEICKRAGVLLHCDAAQAVGKIPVDVDSLGVDLLSFSAHKFYGPKGVGGLYVRRRNPHVRLEGQILGGGHEQGLRSGMLNVPGIVGMAKALEIAIDELNDESRRLRDLRQRLFDRLSAEIPHVALNGPALELPEARLPNNLNVSFALVDGEALLMSMGDVALSTGAACSSAEPLPSHVLRALAMPDDAVRGSLRFGLGRGNTADQIDRVVERLAATVAKLRSMSSASPPSSPP